MVLLGVFMIVMKAAFAQSAPIQTTAPFVKINGETQTVMMGELLLREQLARGVPHSPELQTGVRETLIRQSLMEQEAVKAGLDKQVGVQAQLKLAKQNVLAQAWQQSFLQSIQLQESELQSEYQRQIKLLGPHEYRVRHLLVQEEATARLLLEKVRAGTRIADLAAEYSRDQATRGQGGLTDWTPQGQLLPTIAKVIEGLQPGQWVSSPVASPLGWHVVQLDQSRAFVAPEMEKVKPQLVQALLQQRLQDKVDELRKNARIE